MCRMFFVEHGRLRFFALYRTWIQSLRFQQETIWTTMLLYSQDMYMLPKACKATHVSCAILWSQGASLFSTNRNPRRSTRRWNDEDQARSRTCRRRGWYHLRGRFQFHKSQHGLRVQDLCPTEALQSVPPWCLALQMASNCSCTYPYFLVLMELPAS